VVAVVQISPSSHEEPSLPGLKPQPVIGSHVATSHGDVEGKHPRDAPPLQAPLRHDSPMTHLSPEEHAAPLPTFETTQPVPTTQVAVWQGFVGRAHWRLAPPPHIPALHVVPTVQTLPSSQGVPSAALTMPQFPFDGSQAPTLHGFAGVCPGQLTPAHRLPPASGCVPPSVPASGGLAVYIVVVVFDAPVFELLPTL
jgi:hypothetical protein